MNLENMNFWDVHGVLFILCMCFFPRLTMLFATAWGGCLWWFGWLLAPRLTVAILATYSYWDTNPVLVVFTWLWALAGEGGEKSAVKKGADQMSA
jgi:hypothetical protein